MTYLFRAKNAQILDIALKQLLSLGYVYGKTRKLTSIEAIEENFPQYKSFINLSWDSEDGIIHAHGSSFRYENNIDLESILSDGVDKPTNIIELANGWLAKIKNNGEIYFSNPDPKSRIENMCPDSAKKLFAVYKKMGLL